MTGVARSGMIAKQTGTQTKSELVINMGNQEPGTVPGMLFTFQPK
jgi:hypothetical protein